MTNEQSVALDKFLTENAINLDDAKKEIIRLIDVRRQEKWAQRLEEREAIKKRFWGKCFCENGEYYYKVVANGTYDDECVRCILVFKDPSMFEGDSYVTLRAVMLEDVNYEEFNSFKRISEDEFKEALMDCVNRVLEMKYD